VAEELALEELAGKGRAVDLDERFPAANAALVESAGDALLADAALAADEDRNVGLRDAVDHVPDAEHRRAHRDELARGPSPQRRRSHRRRSGTADDDRRRFGPRGCRDDRIVACARRGAAAIDRLAQLVGLDRLHEVVARAEPHGLDDGLLVVHRGERDDRRDSALGPIAPQDLESVDPRHPQVEQYGLRRYRRAVQMIETAPAIGGREGVISDSSEKLDEDLASRFVVVDDQHLVGSFKHPGCSTFLTG